MYCTVELDIPSKTPSFTVSADAMIFNEHGLQVAEVENGQVRFHKVTVTRDLGKQVEISSGVRPGDQVILNPSVDLADGSKVNSRPVKIS
jgi:multidrug efflux pump subunit AcrA (membrane-fusion protein)